MTPYSSANRYPNKSTMVNPYHRNPEPSPYHPPPLGGGGGGHCEPKMEELAEDPPSTDNMLLSTQTIEEFKTAVLSIAESLKSLASLPTVVEKLVGKCEAVLEKSIQPKGLSRFLS